MLEQKVKKALEEIGFSKKVAYKVGFVDFSQKGPNPFLRICSAGLTVLPTPGCRLLSSSSKKRKIGSRFTTQRERVSRRMAGLSQKIQSISMIFDDKANCLILHKFSSRSRLGGQKPKEISSKLNFASFLDHYQSYPIAQQLFNKMIRLL